MNLYSSDVHSNFSRQKLLTLFKCQILVMWLITHQSEYQKAVFINTYHIYVFMRVNPIEVEKDGEHVHLLYDSNSWILMKLCLVGEYEYIRPNLFNSRVPFLMHFNLAHTWYSTLLMIRKNVSVYSENKEKSTKRECETQKAGSRLCIVTLTL